MSETTDGKWPCVMVDIETLGTGDDAVILEVGVACFDREGRRMGPEWGVVVDYLDQPERKVEPDTLAWWLEPERMGRLAEMLHGSETRPQLWHALVEMSVFLKEHLAEGGEVWAKGDFDLRILGNALDMYELVKPWKYHQARELRTVLKITGVKDEKATAHRAVEDARRQVELLWRALDPGVEWLVTPLPNHLKTPNMNTIEIPQLPMPDSSFFAQ